MIARLEKGNKARTAMHSAVVNEIIDVVNALSSPTFSIVDSKGKVISGATGQMLMSGKSCIIQIKLPTITGGMCVENQDGTKSQKSATVVGSTS